MPRGGAAALAGVGALAVWSALWRLDRADWKLDEDAYAQAGWYLVHDGGDPNRGHPPLAKLAFGKSTFTVLSKFLGSAFRSHKIFGAVKPVSAGGVKVPIELLRTTSPAEAVLIRFTGPPTEEIVRLVMEMSPPTRENV